MRSLPHVNFSYPLLNNPLNPQDILSLSSESYHGQETLYIVSRLVESHNDDLNRIEKLEREKQKLSEHNHKLTSELRMLHGENRSKDEQIGKLRSMLSQASRSIGHSEEDYQVLQRQIQLLTKKMQVLLVENQQLSAALH